MSNQIVGTTSNLTVNETVEVTGLGDLSTSGYGFVQRTAAGTYLAQPLTADNVTNALGYVPFAGSAGTGTVLSVTLQNTDGYLVVTNPTVTTSGTITINLGTVPISKGGTGQTTAVAAANALLPSQSGITSGYVLSTDGAGNLSWVAGGSGGSVTSITGTTNQITASASTGAVTLSIATGYVGQTSIHTLGTITTGTWNGTAIAAVNGGTGQTGYTTGDILYASSTTALSKLAAGTSGYALTSNGPGVAPSWQAVSAVTGVSSITGTANQITASASVGAVTLSISSTYPGQTSITTVGTIGTGAWQGNVVGSTYGGTGVNNGSSTITLAGNLVTSGANPLTLTTTGSTNVTLPTSGTLVNTAVTSLSSLTGASSLSTVGTITTGTWNGSTVGVIYGGTGLNSATTGDIRYASAANVLSALAIGTNKSLMFTSSGLPAWTTNLSWDDSSYILGVGGSGGPGSGTITFGGGTATTAGIVGQAGFLSMQFNGSILKLNTTNGLQVLLNSSGTPSLQVNLSNAVGFYTGGGISYGTSGNVLVSAGSTAAPAWTAQSSLAVGNITGGANGSLLYQTGSGTTSTLAIGSTNQVLTVSGGVPVWSYQNIPQNAQAGTSYTLALTDGGGHVYATNSSPITITIPANASVAFPIGTSITIVAAHGGGTVSIGITSDTMYLAGATNTTGTRTLTSVGVATILKVATTTWVISGVGLN